MSKFARNPMWRKKMRHFYSHAFALPVFYFEFNVFSKKYASTERKELALGLLPVFLAISVYLILVSF